MPKLTALQRHAKSAADLSHVFTEGEIQGMRKGLHQADRDQRRNVEDVGNAYSFYVPVYGVVATDGEFFRYCYGSWQAGSRVMVNP